MGRIKVAVIFQAMICGVLGARLWGQTGAATGALTSADAQVEMTTVGEHAFRFGVRYRNQPFVYESTFVVDPRHTTAASRPLHVGEQTGIESHFGKMLAKDSGEWEMMDGAGKALITSAIVSPPQVDAATGKSWVTVTMKVDGGEPLALYGSGNGGKGLEQAEGKTRVGNGKAVVPYFWSSAGFGCLAVGADDNLPATWTEEKDAHTITWTVPGTGVDLYLFPAADLRAASEDFSELTGRSPVPPRWTLGYLQSRWGWEDRGYIDETLKRFTEGHFPVDGFIFDFEWYTPKPDYTLKPEGVAGFADFGWNGKLFPEPAVQVAALKEAGVHFVGIRKPRLGNDESLVMIREKHWDMPEGKKVDARTLNFQNGDARDWYAEQLGPLLGAGVDGWWDDEGEITYTTYYDWNEAEEAAEKKFRPNARLWTINRAFSPGLQRFGAAAWTGDIDSTWAELGQTPTDLLNWSLAGMAYGACDIGGFKQNISPELYTRWMEAGVFFPVMRAHSSLKVTPRFPWLYGAEAEAAVRKALQLRYRLIPVYYSLAHEVQETGHPIMRPLLMEFPKDAATADMSDEWMMGANLLAAPVLAEGEKRSVYFPDGAWYRLDTNQRVEGNRRVEVAAGLDEIPAYVRAGTVLGLAPGIEHTSELPGGPLDLQIYPGADGDFVLVEDDGVSRDYLKGKARRTVFHWNDAKRELRWKAEGDYAGADIFTSMRVTVFGESVKKSEMMAVKDGGVFQVGP